MTQSSPKLTAFQSKACSGWSRMSAGRSDIPSTAGWDSRAPSRPDSQGPPGPDKEAVLSEEVGEVPPGPERRRVIGSPFAADEELLRRDEEQDQDDLSEDQGKDRADDLGVARSQHSRMK